MSEPFEDRLRKATADVRDLEQQLDKFNRDNSLREAVGTLTPARALEGQQLQNRLYKARQRQTFLLLESTSESTKRLAVATESLNRTSEAQVKIMESQVKIAESQVKVSESQAQVMKSLLKSSHLLEQLTVYLMVLTALNIFLFEYSQGWFNGSLGILGGLLLIGTILVMLALGHWLPRLRKLDRTEG